MKITTISYKCFEGTLILWLLMSGSLVWAQPKFKIIHAFGATGDGRYLLGSVVLDNAGHIYGTTYGGGTYLCGTVFELTPGSNGQWTEQQLHNFPCYELDGFGPKGGVAFDASGNLFGTTYSGNGSEGGGGDGTVFELIPASNGWTEKVLYSFNGNDGSGPNAGVTVDSRGNLYGTTLSGGSSDCGTTFSLMKAFSGWTFSVLHDFRMQNPEDGCSQSAGVVRGKSGNIEGLTTSGGTANLGVAYALLPMAGGTWKEQIYNCGECGSSNGVPASDSAGTLYGTATYGGLNTCGGNVYPCGSIWQLTRQADGQVTSSTLYSFQDGSTGSLPVGGVVRDKAGNLYGTTSMGGITSASCPEGCGVVYELARESDGSWAYKILHAFNFLDGAAPNANLTLDGKGNLFGTTQDGGANGVGGVVFEMSP